MSETENTVEVLEILVENRGHKPVWVCARQMRGSKTLVIHLSETQDQNDYSLKAKLIARNDYRRIGVEVVD